MLQNDSPTIVTHEQEKSPNEDRLTVLSDGVFAIAMTLLVLNISIPKVPAQVDPQIWFGQHFGDYLSEIITYLIAFTVLASYWMAHRRLMQRIQRLDTTFTWLTFLFLAFIAFFPAATNMTMTQGDIPEVVIFYTVVLAGCGFTSCFLWLYASVNAKLISPTLSGKQVRNVTVLQLIAPLYFCLTLLLLFIVPKPNDVYYSWPLLVVIGAVVRRFEQRT
jgi:uncharacterized membrane protein